MPRVPYQIPAFPTTFAQPDAPPAAAPTWGELFDAGFGLENDVKNAYDLMTRPKFPRDPDYPLANKLKDTPFWDEYRDNFIGTQSDEELLWRMDKIREEQKQRETLARGGWAGITAMVAAGVASPVSFIPLAGPAAKGWQLVRQAAGLGALGAAIQEAPLLANQETRTIGETAFSLGASTILSGLLGGAVAALKPGERAALEAGIANPPVGTAISIPQPGGVGAAAVGPAHAGGMDPGPGNLAWALAKGVDSNPVTRSPVIDELNSDWRSAQYTMAQFDDGGVRLIGNTYGVPTTPGGTVSNRVATWYGNFWKGTSAHDEAYAKYYFDNNIPTILPNVRSAVGGITGAGGKISRQQFNKEVAEAFHNGDIHPDANAPYSAAASEAAKAWRKDVYDPILKELQSSGVFKQLDELDEGEQTDKSYLNWVFHHGLIGARPNEFIDFLTKEFNEVYQAEFAKRLEKFQTKDLESRQLIEDIQTPEEQIEEMRDIYGAELREVEEGAEATHITALEDTISELRSRARELQKETGDFAADAANKEYRKQLLKDARDLERSEAERLKPTREKRRALKRRLSNLNKAQVVLEDRVVKKLEKIENSEELSLATLNRAARAGQKALVALSKVSDDKLDEVVERLRNTFAKTADMYDRGEERIVRLTQGEEDFDMLGMAAKQEDKFVQLTQIAERLGQAESIDRAAVRELIDAAMQETLTKIQQITSRRAIRNAKLMEQARAIAPDTLANRIAKITGEARTRRQDFEESLRLKGAADVDLDKGVANFTEQAKADAIAVRHKIQGTYLRLPVVEVAQGERGAVLARNLGFIPTERMKPWLEMDMEKLARTHVRTMAPDLEIAKKFGTIDLGEIIDPMVKEYDARIDALRTATDKKGKPLSQAAQEKRAKELAEELARHKGNVEAVYKRLRHQWGLPTDPDGMGYRLARTVQNLNVLRFMGNVTISSIPDLARPVMRHGLTRVFRDGFVPLVTNFKQFRATADWLRYAGVGTDVVLNTRIAQMNDILDDLQRGSKFERGVEWMTNRMGIVALFNYWTDTMKQFTGVVAHARLMDSIASVMEGKGNVRAATQYLAEVGIGGKEAAEIWEHARATGGASKVNGVWLPDTELWDAASPAARNYAAAIAREVNNNIVTPGVERPLWTNRTVTGSMIAQFKSFAFSSTQKTLLAGLQQRDANFAVGSAISLALGALSYYIYASATGGETKEKMLNADVDKWADEAIDRSGMLAVFGPGRDLLSRIPTTAPYATFSGGRTTRRGGDNLMDALLGPSFDFATTAAEVVTGMDDPTQSTFHSFRKLMPYQNTTGPLPHLFQLRSIYDTIEEANPLDLPETRR